MSSVRFSGVSAAFLIGMLLVYATAAIAGDVSRSQTGYLATIAGRGHEPVRLHVEEMGAGAPLILIHGLGGSGYSWRRLMPTLAQKNHVFAIDLKGFGRSDKPFETTYTPSDQARLIASFMRQTGLTQATVVGHSFGGTVALALALALHKTEPQRIRRLILLNSPAYPQDIPRKQAFLTLPVVPYLALVAIPPIFTARAGLASAYLGIDHVTDTDIGVYADPLHEAGGRHALITTTRRMAEIAATGQIAAYETLRMPSLLIWCRNDSVVPLSIGQRLQRQLPHAELAVIERCDHTPAEEAPAETVSHMQKFLRR
jgi:pimeloyl-ACP methyl ester carboxylesterase